MGQGTPGGEVVAGIMMFQLKHGAAEVGRECTVVGAEEVVNLEGETSRVVM